MLRSRLLSRPFCLGKIEVGLGVEVADLFGSCSEGKSRHQDKIAGRLDLLRNELEKVDTGTAEAILDGCLALTRSLSRERRKTQR